MKYSILFKKSAEKYLDSIQPNVRKRILFAISKLPEGDVAKLQGYSQRFRLRVGGIRIIFDKFEDKLIILVLEIGSRGDIYK